MFRLFMEWACPRRCMSVARGQSAKKDGQLGTVLVHIEAPTARRAGGRRVAEPSVLCNPHAGPDWTAAKGGGKGCRVCLPFYLGTYFRIWRAKDDFARSQDAAQWHWRLLRLLFFFVGERHQVMLGGEAAQAAVRVLMLR